MAAAPSFGQWAQPVRMYRAADTPPLPTRYGVASPELDGTGWFLRAASPPSSSPGTLQAVHRSCDSPQLDDQCDFNTISPNAAWVIQNFTLKARSDRFYLWVVTEALNEDLVTEADVAALAQALGEQTPSGSINPNAGILENIESIFGDAPDYDGDGLIDILWFDIVDNFATTGRFFSGFVHSEDTNPDAPAGAGNQANVIYLDFDPLLINEAYGITDVQRTIAEVYTDLIHITRDPDELPFVRVGVREWAKTLNGLPSTTSEYLQDPIEHNIPLLLWDAFPGDFQRASLFTNYLAEQLGPEAIGMLLQNEANGEAGYRAVVDALGGGRTLPDFVRDFHTANYVNAPLLDPRFGYTTPGRQGVGAAPTLRIDASQFNALAPADVEFGAGGVLYLSWDNVAGLQFTLNASATGREQLRIHIVTDRLDGTTTITPLDATDTVLDLSEPALCVTIVMVHGEISEPVIPINFSATWTGTALAVQTVAYDSGELESDNRFVPLGEDWKQAVRFDVPDGFGLHRVSLAPYYSNQFNSDPPPPPPTAPRDLTLVVWADDGNGQPGDELLAVEVEDPRAFEFANDAIIDFFPVDLFEYPAMAQLPETIHVGITEAGGDDNFLVLALSPYDVESTSSLFGPLGAGGAQEWFDLWGLSVGESTLENRTFPIRVQFRVPPMGTGAEAEPALPAAFVLRQNYPNPFNPRTLIPYTLSVAAAVRLAVYDVLGREVSILVEAVQPAGAYAVPFDAAGLGAGTYFYRLETPTHHFTRPMLLLK